MIMLAVLSSGVSGIISSLLSITISSDVSGVICSVVLSIISSFILIYGISDVEYILGFGFVCSTFAFFGWNVLSIVSFNIPNELFTCFSDCSFTFLTGLVSIFEPIPKKLSWLISFLVFCNESISSISLETSLNGSSVCFI